MKSFSIKLPDDLLKRFSKAVDRVAAGDILGNTDKTIVIRRLMLAYADLVDETDGCPGEKIELVRPSHVRPKSAAI